MAKHHRFGKRSNEVLLELEDDLQRVCLLALKYSKYDFGLTDGLRTEQEQRKNIAAGASQTMHSRHLPNKNGLSEAVDIIIYVNGKSTWDPKYYRKVASAFFKAAFELGVPIEWGGHWESIFDGPHYQLSEIKA